MSQDRKRSNTLTKLTNNLKSDLSIIGGLEHNLSCNRKKRFANYRQSLSDYIEPGLFYVVCQLAGHDETECPSNSVVYNDAEGIPLPLTQQESRHLARPLDRFAFPRAVAHRIVESSLALQDLYSHLEDPTPIGVDLVLEKAFETAVVGASVALHKLANPPSRASILRLDHGVLLTLQAYHSAIFAATLLEFASAVSVQYDRDYGPTKR